eukprot:10863025-Alexandrium_andersonii.AAC.1
MPLAAVFERFIVEPSVRSDAPLCNGNRPIEELANLGEDRVPNLRVRHMHVPDDHERKYDVVRSSLSKRAPE